MKRIIALLLAVVLLFSCVDGLTVSAIGTDTDLLTTDTEWQTLQKKLDKYEAVWTDGNLTNAVYYMMAQTALMGNGDVGANSDGTGAEKTYRISKQDFWDYDRANRLSVGGVTVRGAVQPFSNLTVTGCGEIVKGSDNYALSNIVDGAMSIGDDLWACNGNHETAGHHHFTIDFGKVYALKKYVIYHQGAYNTNSAAMNTVAFTVSVSSDGTNYETVQTVTENTANTTEFEFDSAKNARYVKVEITDPSNKSNDTCARIAEMAFYEEAEAEMSISGCGELSEYPLANIIDGSETSYGSGWACSTDHGTAGYHHFTIDLGNVYALKSYELCHQGTVGATKYDTAAFTVSVSSDGTDYETVQTETNNTASTTTFTFENVTNVRYVKVEITDPTQDNTTVGRMAEMRFYDAEGNNIKSLSSRDFKETLSIVDGTLNTDMVIEDVPVSFCNWVSATDNVMITQVTSKGTTAVTLESELFVQTDYASKYPLDAGTNQDGTIWVSKTSANSKENTAGYEDSWKSKVVLMSKVLGAESTAVKNEDGSSASFKFTLPAEETVYILTAVGGGGQNYDWQGTLQGTEPATEASAILANYTDVASISTLKTANDSWWKDYWLKSYVDIGDEQIHRYYYGSLYYMACTARADTLPSGLYGIWATTDNGRWHSDYHLNYNMISPFYGMYSSNRAEFAKSLKDPLLDYLENGKQRAVSDLAKQSGTNNNQMVPEYINGGNIRDTILNMTSAEYSIASFAGRTDLANGIEDAVLYPVGIGPWGLTTDDTYWMQVYNAGFSAMAVTAYYNYTKDATYFAEVYPFLLANANFYEAWCEKEVFEDGTYRYNIWSGAHEKTFDLNAGTAIGTVKNILECLIDAVEDGVLKIGSSEGCYVTQEKYNKWVDMYENFADYPVADGYYGQGVSYSEPTVLLSEQGVKLWKGSANVDLEFVAPAQQAGFDTDTALLEAARNAIELKESANSNIWNQTNNTPKIYLQAIRVGVPAGYVMNKFKSLLNAQMLENYTINDGTHGIEKAGAIEFINTMLLQSDDGIIKVFPNWTGADASFTRLRERGAFVVSSSMHDGKVTQIEVTSEAGGNATFVNPWGNIKVLDASGDTMSFTRGTTKNTNEETITFNTTKGASYTLVEDTNGVVESVSLDKESVSLEVGQTASLSATVTPNTAANTNVAWESSDTSVATVENGVVTAQGLGAATITVRTVAGGKTDTCEVVVENSMLKAALQGKTISILGDSISTYEGWSNNATSYNSTIGGNQVYYNGSRSGVTSVDQTYWKQLIDQYGMTLCVNNSSSGSRVIGKGNVSKTEDDQGYATRPYNLHDDTVTSNESGEAVYPDIITVYMGVNDLINSNGWSATTGTYESINWSTLIQQSGTDYTYATPTTVAEAYAIMIHKITVTYPDAEVLVFNLPLCEDTQGKADLTVYNDFIEKIVDRFDATLVDLYNSEMRGSKYNANSSDGLHPKTTGHDLMTDLLVEALISTYEDGDSDATGNMISVTEESVVNGQTINLTDLGTVDWLSPKAGNSLSYERKANPPAVVIQGAVADNAFVTSEAGHYITSTWNDGSETKTSDGSTVASVFRNGVGKYVEFSVPAQAFEQTLTLSLGVNRSVSTLSAWFESDSSAVTTVATIDNTDTADKVSGLTDAHYTNKAGKIITIKFSSSKPRDNLILRYEIKDYDSSQLNADKAWQAQMLVHAIALSATPELEIADVKNGKITVDKSNPYNGETIVVTATPDAGYMLVTDSLKQNETVVSKTDGKYSFVMPYANVTLTAEFVSVAELQTLVENAKTKLATLTEESAEYTALSNAITSAESLLAGESTTAEAIASVTEAINNAMPASVTGISLDKSEFLLVVGNTKTITATVTPENASNKSVSWDSSDESVATVENGVVTAVGKGTATITATTTDGGKTASCVVRVLDENDTLPMITSSTAGLAWSQTVNLTELGTVDWMITNGKAINANDLSYYRKNVTDPAISGLTYSNNANHSRFGVDETGHYISASWTDGTPDVSKSGVVTATGFRGAGNYMQFTVDAQEYEQTLVLSLGVNRSISTLTAWFESNPDTVETITTINNTESGDKITGAPTGAHNDNKAGKMITINFSSPIEDDKLVLRYTLTTDNSGKTPTEGQALFNFAALSETQAAVTGVTVDKTAISLAVDGTETITATVVPDNASNKDVSWISSDESVATVADGVVTATGKGTATITVTTADGGKTATCAVTVTLDTSAIDEAITTANGAKVDVEVSDRAEKVTAGKQFVTEAEMTALTDAIAAATTAKENAKTSTDVTNAVNALNAAVTTFTNAKKTGTYVAVTDISLNKTVLKLSVGDTETLVAKITPENATNKSVTWETSDDKVVTVDQNGKVTAVGKGVAKITVTITDANGNKTTLSAVCTVDVELDVSALQTAIDNATTAMNSVSVIDDKAENEVAKDTKFVTTEVKQALEKAIADAEEAKESAKTSEDVTNAFGTLTTAVNTFNSATKTGTYIAVTGVSLNKTEVTLAAGSTDTLQATVTPADATDQRITWTSSDDKVVTVANGLVTAVGKGEATITVTTVDGNKSASCKFTVTLDTSAISSAIDAADAAKSGVKIIDDQTANQVTKGTKFVTTAEMKALTDAIAAAKEAKESAKTEADVTSAVNAMNAAVETFKQAIKTVTYVAPVDVSAIDTTIAAANAAKEGVETSDKAASKVTKGTKFVTTAEMKALTDAIANAQAAKESAKNTADVTAAVNALNAAVEIFKQAIKTGTYVAPVDVSAIDTAIVAANAAKEGVETSDKTADEVTKGTKFVTTAEMKALTDAIAAAQAAKESAKNAADVTAAVSALNTAVDTFKQAIKTGTYVAPVDVSAIDTAIAAANAAKEGVETSDKAASEVTKGTKFVTSTEMKALTDAIATAKAAKTQVTTAEEVTNVANALNSAVDAFNDCIKTGTLKEEIETKVQVAEGGIKVVPEELEKAGFDTPEEVNEALVKAVISEKGKVTEDDIAHYDVTLMFSEDGGKSWLKADETHFPKNGKLQVTLPYPGGTDKTYTFTVVHMFTSTAFGKTPGDIEMPKVTNTDNGISFEVTGLSPITVGWTAPGASDKDVDVSAIEAAVKVANDTKNGIETIDGKNAEAVAKGTKFVTTAEMKALTDAIATAEAAKESAKNAADVTAAVNALNTAVETFKQAIKTGTYMEFVTITIDVTATVENKTQPGISPADFKILIHEGDTQLVTTETDDAGKAKFQLSFNAENIGKTVTYTISQKKGHTTGMKYDQTVHTIKVTVEQKADGSLYTIINEKETDTVSVSFKNVYEKSNTPVTGDNSQIILFGGLMFISIASIAVILLIGKQKKVKYTGKHLR